MWRNVNVQLLHYRREGQNEKIEIFKEPQNGEVGDDAAGQPQLSAARIGLAGNAETNEIVEHARKNQERQEPVIPPAVKEITGDDDQDVTRAEIIPEQPVQQQEVGEEFDENPGIKEHASRFPRLSEIDSWPVF